MDWTIEKCRGEGRLRICLHAVRIGRDLLVCLEGGERPHIGCAVLAVPRQSLTGSGKTSATSSVLNISGHKDDILCRKIADSLSAALEIPVVCTGGVHTDNIAEAEIQKICQYTDELIAELIGALCPA